MAVQDFIFQGLLPSTPCPQHSVITPDRILALSLSQALFVLGNHGLPSGVLSPGPSIPAVVPDPSLPRNPNGSSHLVPEKIGGP